MHYHQNSKLKTTPLSKTLVSGTQVKQIVYDKQITQEWNIKTDNKQQLLPYSLRHLYLSRICQFWHLIKFFYFQNYENNQSLEQLQLTQNQQSQEIQQYHLSSQKLEKAKGLFKTIWKFTRNRLLFAVEKIKQQYSYYSEQSSELEGQKLQQYMKFLKMQPKIQQAFENLDSVVEKNIRRKLLEGFLILGEHLRNQRKKEKYRDRTKLEIFQQLCQRFWHKRHISIAYDCFIEVFNQSEQIRYREEEKLIQERQRQQRQKQAEHFKSISNKKGSRQQEIEQRQTINKIQRNNKQTSRENISTIKRQKQEQSKSYIKSMGSQYSSNIKITNNNNQIYRSHYYYDQQGQSDRNSRLNGLPTKRINNQKYSSNEKYSNLGVNSKNLINGIQNVDSIEYRNNTNINNQSNIKDMNFNSHQIKGYYKEFPTTNSHHHLKSNSHSGGSQQAFHIPITQRIQKHYYQQDYEQEHEQYEEDENEQQDESVQQIYVVRNYTKKPKRKPDQWVKVPITSANIKLVQIPLQKKLEMQGNLHLHSNSYYERVCCQNCVYCTKLKQVQNFVKKINNQQIILIKRNFKREITQEKIIKNQVITTEMKQNFNGKKTQIKQTSTIPSSIEKETINLKIDTAKLSDLKQMHKNFKANGMKMYVQTESHAENQEKDSKKFKTERKVFRRKPMY